MDGRETLERAIPPAPAQRTATLPRPWSTGSCASPMAGAPCGSAPYSGRFDTLADFVAFAEKQYANGSGLR